MRSLEFYPVNPVVRKLYRITKHIGNRDKDGIIYESNAMLQEDFNLSAPQKVYILSAFIMSAVAADKNEIALEQWAQYKDEAFPDQRAWPFVLDLLLNMARNLL